MARKFVVRCAAALLTITTLVGCSETSGGGESTDDPSSSAEATTQPTEVPTPTEFVTTSEPTETETTESGLLAPDDADDLEGDNYEDVVEDFEDIGFTNVSTEVIDDLKIGLLVKDGEIEDVTIDGDDDFDNETPYPADAEVVVTYHTFPEEDAAEGATVHTVENNSDLEALLAGPAKGKTVEEFVEEYNLETISFDAFVVDRYINPREYNGESYVRLKTGDASDAEHTGPLFEIGWIGHTRVRALEALRKGDNIRVTALVGVTYDFAPHQLYLVEDDDAGVKIVEPR